MSSPDENPLECPTFSSYSRDGLVEIATKVSNDCGSILSEDETNDNLFEFALPDKELDSSVMHEPSTFPVFNQEIFHNLNEPYKNTEIRRSISVGHKPSTFPIFKQEIFDNLNEPNKNIENPRSTSSDKSEHKKPGPFCLWRVKSIGSSTPSSCKKSKSTGSLSFKRFKIRDLLRRSNSDVTSSCMSETKLTYRKSLSHSVKGTGKTKASVHEVFYMEKRSIKEGDKRKSYLPYRKDLFGIFSVFSRRNINQM